MSWCFISWFISHLQAAEKWYVMVFPFQFPLLSLQSLPSVENFTEIKKKKLPGWLDFPLLSQLYHSGSSDLFCNQRGQLGTAWAHGMGNSGWHMAPQLLWNLRKIDFRWKDCVLPAPWVKEEWVWHCMGTMVKGGEAGSKKTFPPKDPWVYILSQSASYNRKSCFLSPSLSWVWFQLLLCGTASTGKVILQYEVGASPSN